jgi:hypothetical protein
MQIVWLDWVKQGCPAPPAALAASSPAPAAWAGTARGQSPDVQPAAVAPPSRGPVAATVGRTSIYAQARRAAGAEPRTPVAGEHGR